MIHTYPDFGVVDFFVIFFAQCLEELRLVTTMYDTGTSDLNSTLSSERAKVTQKCEKPRLDLNLLKGVKFMKEHGHGCGWPGI